MIPITDRLNAARARQRVKDQISDLSTQLDAVSERNHKLTATNQELSRQVVGLTEENRMLRMIIASQGSATLSQPMPGASTAATAKQVAAIPTIAAQPIVQGYNLLGSAASGLLSTAAGVPQQQQAPNSAVAPGTTTTSIAALLAQQEQEIFKMQLLNSAAMAAGGVAASNPAAAALLQQLQQPQSDPTGLLRRGSPQSSLSMNDKMPEDSKEGQETTSV
jgi:hypothetical protein